MENFNIPQIQPTYYNGQKVLSSNQLAALFKCSRQNITDIYRRHKSNFVEGIDFFFLEKEELYRFKVENGLFEENNAHSVFPEQDNGVRSVFPNLPPFSKTANAAYLWTKDGVLKQANFLKLNHVIQTWLQSYFGDNVQEAENSLHSVFPKQDSGVHSVFPNRHCVYAFEIDDGTVKIGRTSAIDARPKEIEKQFSRKVLRVHHTEFFPKSIAIKIEAACCKDLNPFLARGKEFFNITFEKACVIIDKFAAEFNAPQIADFSTRAKLNRLLTFAKI